MKSKRIPPRLRKRVIEFFENRCAYCRSSQELIGALFEIDHIIPLANGGQTVEENLCWCCPLCNRYKGTRTTGVDAVVQENYAYICAGGTLIILDVSDPSNPTKVVYVALPYLAYGVYVQDSFAYVAERESGLRIIDVSDPSSPNLYQ